jgi:hypothetical protein
VTFLTGDGRFLCVLPSPPVTYLAGRLLPTWVLTLLLLLPIHFSVSLYIHYITFPDGVTSSWREEGAAWHCEESAGGTSVDSVEACASLLFPWAAVGDCSALLTGGGAGHCAGILVVGRTCLAVSAVPVEGWNSSQSQRPPIPLGGVGACLQLFWKRLGCLLGIRPTVRRPACLGIVCLGPCSCSCPVPSCTMQVTALLLLCVYCNLYSAHFLFCYLQNAADEREKTLLVMPYYPNAITRIYILWRRRCTYVC